MAIKSAATVKPIKRVAAGEEESEHDLHEALTSDAPAIAEYRIMSGIHSRFESRDDGSDKQDKVLYRPGDLITLTADEYNAGWKASVARA